MSTGTLGHFLMEGFLDWTIQPVYRPIHIVGPALTVSCPPTDNTVLLEAIERASPGDVLVLHRYGDRRYAPWGGILSLAAIQKGIAGVVVIPRCQAAEALARGRKKERQEVLMRAALRQGKSLMEARQSSS